MPKPKGSEIELEKGFTVRERYKVLWKLGHGGFGAVYEVSDKQMGNSHAMKVESLFKKKEPVMKMEVAVSRKLNMSKSKHVVEFFGCGKLEEQGICWIIMGLVGPNLSELRRRHCNGRMTAATVIRIGKQCLQALEDLHKVGYVHRDVKPSNFAIGLQTKNTYRTVFILDFGLARQFMFKNENGTETIRPPRRYAGFKGTVRYASLTAHRGMEQGRNDDLVGLMYSLVELRKGLPWRVEVKRRIIARLKRSTPLKQVFRGCPVEMYNMFKELQKLTYESPPKYRKLQEYLDKCMTRKGYLEENPYDWEKGGSTFRHTTRQRAYARRNTMSTCQAIRDTKNTKT